MIYSVSFISYQHLLFNILHHPQSHRVSHQ